MAMTTLVLTLLGDDRPGLVSAVSARLKAHRASWERSHMARLAGKFAGIVEVYVDSSAADALSTELQELSGQGLTVHVEPAPTAEEPEPGPHFTLDLIGADRPGIVAEISTLLAGSGVSIQELTTQVREAPMAGGLLFEAHAALTAPPGADGAALRNALEQLADELMVELSLSAGDGEGDELRRRDEL
jgi:glycine cleavage system regulatory protein